MIHTWHETPNPPKKEAAVIHNWKWLQKLFLDYVEPHDWRESSGTYHWSTALCDGLYRQGPRCTDGPRWPCQTSPGTATHGPCPRTQRLHFSSALGLQSLPSYAVHVFVSSSVPAKPLPGHEPCWSPAHGPISWPDSGPASSPQTCLTVAVPCLSILSRSPKTDFQRVTQEEQAKKCTKQQHATYIYVCMSFNMFWSITFYKLRNGSLRYKYWSATEKSHALHSRDQKGDKTRPNQMWHG